MPADVSSFSESLMHRNMVLGSAWNKDSRRLLTWSFDNTVRLWDTATLLPALPPVRHRGPVFDAAFSPDERWIASAGRDGTVRLWDAATGERRGPVLRHGRSVTDVEWSRDGTRLVTSGADGLAQLWKVSGLSGPDRECRHKAAVEEIAASPDGRLVAVLTLEPDISVWRMPEGERVARLPHGAIPAEAAWVDAQHLMTVTGAVAMRVWNVVTGNLKSSAEISGMTREEIVTLRLSPDARHLVIVFKNKPPALYRTDGPTLERELAARPAVNARWSPCGRRVLTWHRNGARAEFLLHDPAAARPPVAVADTRVPLATDHDARRLALMEADYGMVVFDPASRSVTAPMPHDAAVHAACFTPDGRVLATGTMDGMLRLWDADTAEPLSPPMPHASWVMSVAVSPDGQRFFTGVNGGVLSEWSVPVQPWTPDDLQRLAGGGTLSSVNSVR
jgi:WD40 repeat protein